MPNVDLAVNAAAEPSASTVNVYPSTRVSASAMASSEMLFTFPDAGDRERVSELRVFALWIAGWVLELGVCPYIGSRMCVRRLLRDRVGGGKRLRDEFESRERNGRAWFLLRGVVGEAGEPWMRRRERPMKGRSSTSSFKGGRPACLYAVRNRRKLLS
jgi:hypothetical protein